jgi:tetratricopeptide (TPR) repeat protein
MQKTASLSRPKVTHCAAVLIGGLVGWQAHHFWLRSEVRSPEPTTVFARSDLPNLGKSAGEKGRSTETHGSKQSASLQETISQAFSLHVVVGEGFKTPYTTDQFGAYLERHQRDAKSLMVVYRITRDEALLREAYAKDPENSKIAAQVLGSLNLPFEEKLTLLEKVRKANPNDALAEFLTSGTLMKEGKVTEALRFLQEGLAKQDLDLGVAGSMLDAREALMAAGKSPTEARVLSAWFRADVPTELSTISQTGSEELKKLVAEGREDEAFALAGSLLGLGGRLEHSLGEWLAGDVMGYVFKSNTLQALPKDVEIGDTGKTAEELFDLNQEEIDSFTTWSLGIDDQIKWHLENLDDAGVDLCFQIIEERGERAGLEWAEAYHGPSPKK